MKRIQVFLYCVSTMAMLFAVPLCAQSDPDLLSRLGAPPSTTTWPFPQGFVNLQNGNFHIEIPIDTLPQRGGKPVTIKLVYDSSFYDYQTIDGIAPIWIVNYSELGVGWKYVYERAGENIDSGTNLTNLTDDQVFDCPPGTFCPGGAIEATIWSNWTYIDGSGTAHGLGGYTSRWDECFNAWATGTFNCPEYPSLSPDNPTSQGVAIDGSGYSISINNYNHATVYNQHGDIVASSSGGSPTDTNGNEVAMYEQNGSLFPQGFSTQTKGITVGVPEGYTGEFPVLAGITLQNGRQYTFTYDGGGSGHNGIMTGMTLPTGGTISFQSTEVSGPGLIPIANITTPDGVTQFNWLTGEVIITAPNNSQTTYTYTGNGGACTKSDPNCTVFTSKLSTYPGSPTGTPLRQIVEQFDQYLRANSVTTTLDGLSQETDYTYYKNPYNLVSAQIEKDFTGGIARETDVTYWPSRTVPPFQPTSTLAYLGDLPETVKVYGAGGSKADVLLAQSNYYYDENLSNSSGSLNVSLPSPIAGHDANYGMSQTARGNLTHVSQMVAPGQFITTKTNYYNVLGEVIQSVDGNGYVTKFDYSDNWADSSCSGLFAFAYPTTLTNAAGQTTSTSYNSCDGSIHSVQDPNGQVTSYVYDNMHRPTSVSYPDGGQTTTNYGDPANPEQITITTLASPSPAHVSTHILDGLGRVKQSVAANGATTDTTYDCMGRAASVSNPYFTTPNGYTTFAYDSLGRKSIQYQPDNGSVSSTCVPPTPPLPTCLSCLQWSYSSSVAPAPVVGHVTTATNENGYSTASTTDALGHLVQVVEPGSLTTSYSYDALNNLHTVNQLGNGVTDVARVRSFSYDGLSRLLCASNPENSTTACPTTGFGATAYTYYDNGNLWTKTDTRGVITTYRYDKVNRLLSRSYSDGSTPLSCFSYDSSSIANGTGRLASAWTQSASAATCLTNAAFWTKRSILAYDAMGRILNEQQCTPSNCTNGTPYSPAYTYDLAGNLLTSTSGVGPTPAMPIVFTSTYDGAGQLQELNSSWINNGTFPAKLFSSPNYEAFGALAGATFGNGLTLARKFDLLRSRIISENDTGNAVGANTSGSATVTISGAEKSK